MPTKTDWLILALAEAEEGSLSPVQVQKALFVFKEGAGRNLPNDSCYNFVPYNYGPFDSQIYEHLSTLQFGGLVHIVNPTSSAQRRYVITQRGMAQAHRTRQEDPRHASYMKDVVNWVQRHSFSDLVRAIYQRWPEYRQNSVFVDQSST
jgi:hypothetical protein